MSIDGAIESTVRRDRVVIVGALSSVIALSWGYLLSGAGIEMSSLEITSLAFGNGGMEMRPAVWNFKFAGLMFAMWWIMMVAMMLPSAAPMVLIFAAMNRKQKASGNPYVSTMVFASAYLLIWAAFSVAAVAMQWGLERTALISPMLMSANVALSGGLLLAAGVYQLTPLKQVCLNHCRSPLHFMLSRWRSGTSGALRMGIEHGAFCTGCCWFLMGLLFFGGVMNIVWIGGLAVLVMFEKTASAGRWFSYVVGIGLIGWGSAMLAGAISPPI